MAIAAVVVVGALIVASRLSGVGQSLADRIGCAVRSLGTRAGDCGGTGTPTVYDGDGAGAPAGPSDGGGALAPAADPTKYGNASRDDAPVGPEKVEGVEQLHSHHAYYVQSADVKHGTVTVVNPWGIAGYPPITMSYDDYVDAFRAVDTNAVG
ncbi:hypothetical protein [Cellulomonas sp. URHE0023]|uniref:hypothetical protein n=1 Tax=Cellulomonas sp. URHE0023 TaxID=1380354 RepID=UPI000482AE27|nr:hypothetical protein [Cellulomonas sp. URHE0023]